MKTLFALLMVGISMVARAQTSVRVDIESLPKMIEEKNDHYRGADLLQRSAERRTGYLTRSYLPVIEVRGGQESFKLGPRDPMTQSYGSIEARLNLFRGGKDFLEERIREQEAELSRHRTVQTFVDELSKARRAYWNLVYQKEVLRILQAARQQNSKNLEAANKRIRSGIASETDRIEFQLADAMLNEDVTRTSLGIQNSERELKVLLGIAPEFALNTPPEVPHTHDDQVLSSKLEIESHRDVRSLLSTEEIFELRESQSRRWWAPSFEIYAIHGLHTFREMEYADASDRYESVLGIRLSFELFDGLQSHASAAAKALQAEAYRLQAGQTARELKVRFESAKAELILMHELIHSAEESVEQGKVYLARTAVEYGRGVKNSPDVLGANQRFTELQRRAVELKRDYQLAKSDFLAIVSR